MGGSDEAEYVAAIAPRLPQLRRAAFLLCGDWERGDDTLQRALADIFAKWGRIRRADNLDAYIRTVLVHRWIDEQRGRWAKVRLVSDLPDRPAPALPSAEDALDVRAALAQLPPRQRAVLVLRYLCDMSVEETATALSCSTGTVKSQTSDALRGMRHLLEARPEPTRGSRS